MPQIQITGGAFQDAEGNTLTNGFLTFMLSHDEQESSGPSQIVGGVLLKVPLDNVGNVQGTVNIWPNDVLTPSGSYYIVNAYKSDGTQAWRAPQVYTFTSATSPLNLGGIVPANPVPAGLPNAGITLQTNSVNNGSQTKLNLLNGSNITITDGGTGGVTIAAAAAGIPLPTAARLIWHNPATVGASISDSAIGEPILALSSGAGISPLSDTTVAVSSTLGPTWNSTGTGTVSTGYAVIYGTNAIWGGRNFAFISVGSISTTATGGRAMIGLANNPFNLNTGTNLPTNTDYAFFAYEPAVSANWTCKTCDATAIQSTASTVVANSTPHYFQINLTAATSVQFLIDGVVVATHSTRVPRNTQTLAVFFMINPYGLVSLGINCATLYVTQPYF